MRFLLLIFSLIPIFNITYSQNEDARKNEKLSIWVYDSVDDKIIQTRRLDKDTISSEELIGIINSTYQDKVRLDFVSISNDTIFVEIDNSEHLTQKMGTTGAEAYMIIATFTLTELPKIKFVNFDFQDGDHATPGTYNRKLNYKRIQEI